MKSRPTYRTNDPRRSSNTRALLHVSFMCLGFGGYGETKACAARTGIGSPQAAAMRFHNGSADPKSHSRAVWFGGKERIEDLVCLLRWQSHASIADGDQELLIFRSLRFDGEFARSTDILHGID